MEKMEITSIKNIYFSPTGGTKKVAELISSCFELPKDDIDISEYGRDYGHYRFKRDNLCVIAVPSFGGRVPAVALERISQMKGDRTPAILIAAYGNRDYDDTLLELKDTVERLGFSCIGAVAAVTEHSIMRQYGSGRPDTSDEEELRRFAEEIEEKVENESEIIGIEVPGKRPYREYKGVPMKPKASGKCTDCGVCAKECPVGAIPFELPKMTDADKCISCMRCTKICPVHAISCNPLILFAGAEKMKKSCQGRKDNKLFLD